MAGINLLDQLPSGKKGKFTPPSEPSASGSKLNLSFDTGGSEDSKLFLKFLITLGVFYGGLKYFEDYTKKENRKIQVQIDQLKSLIEVENQKKAQLEVIIAEMDGFDQKVRDYQTKIKAVSSTSLSKNRLIKALEYVAVEMPKEVWFSEIVTSSQDRRASFDGYALNAQSVSELIKKLESSIYFPSTKLESIELGKESSGSSGPINSRKFKIVSSLGE
jgi:hypothetical protein